MKKIFFIFVALIFSITQTLQAEEAFAMPEHPVMVMETNYGTIEFLLYPNIAPKACENFIRLAEKGAYNNVPFHRIIPGFVIQGGDYTKGNGTGGHSIWGKPFEDEFSDQLLCDTPGRLVMANAGRNTNGSQFFITTVPTPWLNKKHTVFGTVACGYEIVQVLESFGSASGAPCYKYENKGGSWWKPAKDCKRLEPPKILKVYLKKD